MAHIRVYLETSAEALEEGGYLAHVPELPGCVARGKTKEEAIEKVRGIVAADPKLSKPLELNVEVTEALTLPPDYAAVSDRELDELEACAAALRQALLDTVTPLSPEALQWRRQPGEWTIRQVLGHLATADLWYASRLEEGGLPELLWRLAAARALVLQRLHSLPADARDRVTWHDGEAWTARKVARRMLEHEREHLDHIREILASTQSNR